MKSKRLILSTVSLSVVLLAGLLYSSVALAHSGSHSGFLTSRPAQLRALRHDVRVQPLITSGDTLSNGFTFAATPDGLGAVDNYDGTFTVLANHELSSTSNLSDARVSKLVIDKKTLRIKDAQYLINGTEGYRRFCSATMVGWREGFTSNLFLTGEEATDGKFGGIVVAVDPKTGKHYDLPWLGHLAHENAIALPGFGKIVVVTTEDAAPGYIYMYVADNQEAFLTGKGQLYVLTSSKGTTPDILSKSTSVDGKFVPVSQAENVDAKTLKAAATAKGALTFVRPEDLVYAPYQPGLFYLATTGRSQYLNPATNKPYDAKGRLQTVKLDPRDPTSVRSIKVLLSGDEGDNLLNPDNLAASFNSVLFQEDINDEFRGVRPGRISQYNIFSQKVTPLAELDQRGFDGNPIPGDELGDWESSGIINVSRILGPNTWLTVTQAHTLKTEQFGSVDEGGQLLLLKAPGTFF